MGIVVCISMLLGISLLLPAPWKIRQPRNGSNRLLLITQQTIVGLLVIIGSWNAFWYGVQHLEFFWGKAAFLSGSVMLFSAVLLAVEILGLDRQWLKQLYNFIKPVRLIIVIALCASFLLYAGTLIQLNLGMAILE